MPSADDARSGVRKSCVAARESFMSASPPMAGNWRWRAERARERAAATRELHFETAALKPMIDRLAEHYDLLAREATATAAAWDAGDSKAMSDHAGAFDRARDEPMDTFRNDLDRVCH